MSGFEVAGIVLAVLPLFTGAGKAHAKAFEKAVTPSKYSQELQGFYHLFWQETFELHVYIVTIVRELPGLSEERKEEIIHNVDLDKWVGDQASDIATALEAFLEADDYVAFQEIMGKVSDLLARLTKDGTVHIAGSQKNHGDILAKLKELKGDSAAGKITSGLLERFKFHKRTQDRTTCLKNLKTWRKSLGRIVERVYRAEQKRKALGTQQIEQGPSSRLRSLSRKLFNALSSRWSCNCAAPHEARFCIATCGSNTENDVAKTSIGFNFLISHRKSIWCESTVAIESISPQTSGNREEVNRICDGIVSGIGSKMYSMHLLVEDSDTSQDHRVWRFQHRGSQLPYPDVAVSFQAMLREPMPALIERRRLALTFAYSLMQLHESPWFSSQWESQHMHFFPTASGKIDLERPYLSASFDQFPQGSEPLNQGCFHRNSGILRLGILLIEVHKWQSLEKFRDDGDMIEGQPTPNTDMEVAKRILRTLRGDCFNTYMSAIEACLNVSWVPPASRVSLDDRETLSGMYCRIIKPLEMEVHLGNSILAH